ncbi:unnamed protein product [Cylicocyclus nassatus]|uniref:Uncharacterized protein n=1 Tax=Cylicocyclus nassatus TaxID=53992 RepID=A0AA36DKJ1_CYLNA|nr:unnamed protein product [Cylicocyclus nassatus]
MHLNRLHPMFYAQFVLSKKGPLARIWLAAHWERKLSKAQICETNLQDAVNEIVKLKVKMALRTTGHLLLGIVRIYSRKVKYLLADCNETYLGIRTAFRSGRVEMVDEKGTGRNAISVPEVYRDFNSILPDLDETIFENHLQINQSRVGDITLLEEQIPAQYFLDATYENDDFDDFGDSSLEASLFGTDINFCDFPALPDVEETSGVEQQRDDSEFVDAKVGDAREATPFLDVVAPSRNDEVFFYTRSNVENVELDPYGYEGAGIDREESFVLETLEANTSDRRECRRKQRRLIVDEHKSIAVEAMKANMAEYSDTLQTLELAPPTCHLMRLKESSSVEKLFQFPGCASLRAAPLLRLYQSHLRMQLRDTEDCEIRKDMGMSDELINEEGPLHLGVEHSSPFFEGISSEQSTLTVDQRREDEEDGEETSRDVHRVDRRLKHKQNVLSLIATRLRSANQTQILFHDLMTRNVTRKAAARNFFILLELVGLRAVNVMQQGCYHDIFISAGPNIAQVMAQ